MLNSKKAVRLANQHTPEIESPVIHELSRFEIAGLLDGEKCVGIELGVAEGIFSSEMIKTGKFAIYYGVDVYGDIHDSDEYCKTLQKIGISNPVYRLLRVDFERAADLFPDEFFDFIYVDGFAHTGEEGGQTLLQWYPKLKVGGIFAGDDYHADWPLVKWAVNHHVNQVEEKLNILIKQSNEKYSSYPTWYWRKTNHKNVVLDNALLKISIAERRRIHRNRTGLGARFKHKCGKILDILGLKGVIKRLLQI